MTPATQKYVVINDTGLSLEGSDVVHAKGEVLDLDPESEFTKTQLASGAIGPVADDAGLVDYVVTEEFLKENQALADQGIVVGDTIKVPKTDAADVTDTQKAAEEAALAAAAAEQTAGDAAVAPVEAKLTYAGQEVISRTTRMVNDKEYVHYRLADGSEQDVTDEDDQAAHKAAGIAL